MPEDPTIPSLENFFEICELLRGQLNELSTRHDTLEQIVSNIMLGYVDIAVATEALMTQALAGMDEMARANFIRTAHEERSSVIDLLSQVAKDLNLKHDTDSRFQHLMDDADRGGTPPPTSEPFGDPVRRDPP